MNVILIVGLLLIIFVLFLRQRNIKRDLDYTVKKINYVQNDLDCLNNYIAEIKYNKEN